MQDCACSKGIVIEVKKQDTWRKAIITSPVMGQYYLLANVTKSQSIHPLLMKAGEIVVNGDFQLLLSFLLLDLDNHEYRKESSRSLQNLCLKFLCNNEQLYSQATLEVLPKHLLKKLDVTYLSQRLVGEWARDRLIITGDYSDFSPFPPHGEWRSGNLFKLIDSEHFSRSHALDFCDQYEDRIANIIFKLFNDKIHKVVNLDKKEFLDPQAYGVGEKDILNFTRRGVMAGLVISLIHSTGGGGGDLDKSVSSQGMWAGDRIIICTEEQLDNFESYSDVSNASDVKYMFSGNR